MWETVKASTIAYILFSDPNVDVIFVSPVPLSEETLQYYSKLLGLKSAIDSGNVEDQGDFAQRYKIIVPEAIKSFPVSLLSSNVVFELCSGKTNLNAIITLTDKNPSP